MYSVDKIADRFIDAGCPTSKAWKKGRQLIQEGALKHLVWDNEMGLTAGTLAHIEFGMPQTYEVYASLILSTFTETELSAEDAAIESMIQSLPPQMNICTVRLVCQCLYEAGYRKQQVEHRK